MLLVVIVALTISVALFVAGMFVPARWESAVMGFSALLTTVSLCALVAAYTLGYQLAP